MTVLEPESDRCWETGTQGPGTDDFLIKVCGITSLEDALLSVDLGANALGFNFYPRSPRFIELEAAARILEQLPDDILKVGLVVFDSPGTAGDFVDACETRSHETLRLLDSEGFDAYQFHGLRERDQVPEVKKRIFVATSPELAESFRPYEIIIDTSWGSGLVADWDLVARTVSAPYILSGGLRPDNIGEALAKLEPAGVDVCSGVERAQGQKDPEKLRAFLGVVRTYVSRSDSRSEKN